MTIYWHFTFTLFVCIVYSRLVLYFDLMICFSWHCKTSAIVINLLKAILTYLLTYLRCIAVRLEHWMFLVSCWFLSSWVVSLTDWPVSCSRLAVQLPRSTCLLIRSEQTERQSTFWPEMTRDELRSFRGEMYRVSQNKSPHGPAVFLTFFHKRLRMFNRFLHTHYTFLCTLDYKFLFNYFQLWRSYAILSATT